MASYSSSLSGFVVTPSTSIVNSRFRHDDDTDSSPSPPEFEEVPPFSDERPWTQHIEYATRSSTLSECPPSDDYLSEHLTAQHTIRTTSQGNSESYSTDSDIKKTGASESDASGSEAGDSDISDDASNEGDSSETSSRGQPRPFPLFRRPGDPLLLREAPGACDPGKIRIPLYPRAQTESLEHREALSTKIYEMIDGLRAGMIAITTALEKVNIPAVRQLEKSLQGVSKMMLEVSLDLRGLNYHVCSGNIPRAVSSFWMNSWAVLDSVEDCTGRLWHLLDTIEENVDKSEDYNQQILGRRLNLFAHRLKLVVCSYESGKKPRQTPTERIRILEGRLRGVRAALENLKTENATTSSSAVDKILKTVDLSLPAPNDGFSSSDEDEAKSSRLNSMMGNSGRSFAHGPWQTSFYGSYSGCSFVLRTLELFRTTPENVALMVDIRKVITDLFEAPSEGMESLLGDARSQPLPNQATTLDLLRVVFTRCHPLVSFLHEANFRDMVYRLYNESAVAFSTSSQAFMPLFHAVVGLGILFDMESRKQYGCEYAVAEATKHFFLAKERLDITQCSDLISLQTLMCLTIFLISTSRITAAHAYLGVACSTALRLGLHKRVEEGILLSPAQRDTRNRVFLSLLQLDLYASLVLDIPGFVDLDCIDPEIMTKLQPSTSSRSPYPFDVTAESRAQFSASAKHLELLGLTATGLQTTFAGTDRKYSQAENELEFTDVDIKTLHGVEEKFRNWAKGLSSLPSLPEDPEVSAT
ncbi:Gypsy retrotransposon integrase-like protein 1 [Elasticomyces elasticus]|uniref:Gypsy retrotransposon integrase-like protein 1 n=1 Tax=Exophiala sideris TaxID=1016849 RepID=A0ABR0JS74_9EURO|nr:Gypsy retrotransposon integrase-like protein 1 [Elasticomyces elasticus]KAK5040379.1 Gypsy retrotransposon integrase-like protein 1 [Exophiala sideris]KAK5068757.1 Gypsy retrotransposon integrase-like protein 1 [Exophiala sideris]KAK5186355.1 Gypsy retrotransposon integrase-like protein 1 [Eurotiomycetes sp. CCFEE 6388]